jgi:NADH:ubiquinone oxidoreductase subunit C
VPAPEIVAALQTRFGATPDALGVELPAASLLEALRALRDAHGYRYYVLGTATEREAAYEVLHAVRNLDTGDTLFVKVAVPKDDACVDSAAFVYAGAEWEEREIWDLFGVTFRAHPDLRRILMPDDYPGHPLRKSFAMDTPWGYRPATSPNPEAAS